MADIKKNQKNIIRNILKLASGEGVGRIIGIIAAPIIARIYGPENMGILAIYASLLAILSPFATFKYPLAIPLCRNNVSSVNILTACIVTLIFSSSLIFTILLLTNGNILSYISKDTISQYWLLIPIGVFLHGFSEILSQYSILKQKYSNLAKASIAQKIVGVSIKIALGVFNIKPIGLLLGDLMSNTGGISFLIKEATNDIKLFKKNITKRKILFCFKRYINFPIYRLPSQVLLALSGNLPVFFYAKIFDTATTGQIGLARTMLSIPVTFIGYAVGRAFLGEIAAMGRKEGKAIYLLTKETIKKLFLLSLIPFLIIIIFGPLIFKIVFGADWYESGIYARIFSIFLIIQFIYSPISEGIFNVFEKQNLVFHLEISRLILTVISLYISYYFHLGPISTLLLYSSGLAVQYSLSLWVVMRVIHKHN